jgi:hypothetical protein
VDNFPAVNLRLFHGLLYLKLGQQPVQYFQTGSLRELRQNVTEWMEFYNHERDHQAMDYTTQWSNCEPKQNQSKVA